MKYIVSRAHSDSEGVDKIMIDVIPRYKTSELSGDEWRISARIQFYKKGEMIYETSLRYIHDAAQFLPWILNAELPEKACGRLHSVPEGVCNQPGCSNRSTVTYRLKCTYSAQGEGPLPENETFEYCRSFCDAHKTRGDCGLEDADMNYEQI